MVLLLVVLSFIHLASQSFKFKLLFFLENEFFHIFSFKMCQCKFWNSSVLVTDICEACEIQTQSFFTWTCINADRNLYSLHLFWNISLRCRFWDSGKYFFIMPIFIIKTNVFQHKRKIIHRFNIRSRCLDLCISAKTARCWTERLWNSLSAVCWVLLLASPEKSYFLKFWILKFPLFLWGLLDSWLQVL